jgi:class 3 adenylate cyclase/pimeloyl-ACP methyl ester carboxylesterase
MISSVQYVRSTDGTNLAYTTVGEGEPAFVQVPVIPWSYFQREWQLPERRAMYESFGARRRLVLYDSRGCGLSDRSSRDFSLETQIADLESVVDGLGLENFILMGAYQTSMTAIAFAAKHPDRISRLVLWSAYANAPKTFSRAAQFRTMRALREAAADWTLYTETLSRVAMGWQDDDYAARNAAFLRDACSPEVAWAALDAMSTTDVSDRLPQITAPTLVIHRSGVPWPVLDDAREIVGQIPNARLAVVEGSAWPVDGSDPALSLIAEFLGDEPRNRVEPPATVVAEGMSAILFADIVDSTALTERMGDAAFRKRARALDEALRRIVREHSGRPVEGRLLGDGILAVFGSARRGVEAALSCRDAGDEIGLPLHVGMHAGDVVNEEGNVFGGAVNLAARVAALAAPAEVLVSQTVRDLARTSATVTFEDRDQHHLKGVEEPQRVFAVRRRD